MCWFLLSSIKLCAWSFYCDFIDFGLCGSHSISGVSFPKCSYGFVRRQFQKNGRTFYIVILMSDRGYICDADHLSFPHTFLMMLLKAL